MLINLKSAAPDGVFVGRREKITRLRLNFIVNYASSATSAGASAAWRAARSSFIVARVFLSML